MLCSVELSMKRVFNTLGPGLLRARLSSVVGGLYLLLNDGSDIKNIGSMHMF